MKKVYLILFISLFSLIIQAQVEWVNNISYSYANRTANIGADNKGNVYIAGTFQPGYHDRINPWGVFVSKYDSLGNLLWTDTSKATQVKCNGLAVDDAGNCYIIGMVINNVSITFGATTISPPDNFHSFFLVKYNPQGEVQWVNQTLNASGTDIVILRNSIYITGGYSDPTNFGKYSLTNNYGGFLLKCDTSGNYLWAKDLGGVTGLRLDAYGSGNLYVQTGNTDATTQISRYNSSGGFIWAMDAPYGMRGMSADNEGNCYLTWGPSADNFIGKIDSTSGFLWQKNIANTVNCMIQSQLNGDYLFTGELYESSNSSLTRLTVYEKADGKFIKNIDIINPPYINEIITMTNDNFRNIYIAGNTAGGSRPSPFAFLAKITDSSLNFTSYTQPTSTDTITTIPVVSVNTNTTSPTSIDTIPTIPVVQIITTNTIATTSLKEFNVFPNPANGVIQINYSSPNSEKDDKQNLILSISNSNGQIIYSENISHFLGEFKKDIDLSKQAKGVYFIEIIADGKREVKRIVLD